MTAVEENPRVESKVEGAAAPAPAPAVTASPNAPARRAAPVPPAARKSDSNQGSTERKVAALEWLHSLVKDPPEIIRTPQPSLADLLAYSQEGEWTTARTGAARWWHGAYTWVVALPAATVAYTLAWIVRRPGRLGVATPIVLALGTSLAQAPVIGSVVPSVLDITSWF